MKKRQIDLLNTILNHEQATISSLLQVFKISKRTLYYDIEAINYRIRKFGQLKNINKNVVFIGNLAKLQANIDHLCSYEYELVSERVDNIAYRLFRFPDITIDSLSDELGVSRSTVVGSIDRLRLQLSLQDVQLIYNKEVGYAIVGNELKIREYFLQLMENDNNIFNKFDVTVVRFNQEHGLQLSDYSLSFLSNFISFVKKRIKQGYVIASYDFKEKNLIDYYRYLPELLQSDIDAELAYMSAYILGLPNMKPLMNSDTIRQYVDVLVKNFEFATATEINDKDYFKENLFRHMLSSYYRIKYHFPAVNTALDQIKYKYGDLFIVIRNILEDTHNFPDFQGIREEEIGFITIYFGGYLEAQKANKNLRNRVIIVCPHGLMISRQLEIQLTKAIPNIEIVATIPLNQLLSVEAAYDYIVSTIDLPDVADVIVVNPLLSKMDISTLLERISNISITQKSTKMDEILEVIRKNAIITDEMALIQDVMKLLFYNQEEGVYQPMLHELLTKERIRTIPKANDWRTAIEIASEPLLADQSIETSYIQEMIENVEEYGPYIVLTDYFALAHSSGTRGVNQLSMALLVVEEAVDMLGSPVHVFLVLATVDSESHIKALAELSDLLSDAQKRAVFRSGNVERICAMIQTIH